ncbi:hypothetical protein ZEAMMB73_Zm00001d040580 [Zea mays]|jgi:hypothetical protein|uniref:Uncharacterized protein n=1 Tax=Zea mays TaxID=4577 RepID=A0A096RSH8_MAIZE|nr:hypothetical protein ZEAMMB73_Zm00001d040580 [Zea mays]
MNPRTETVAAHLRCGHGGGGEDGGVENRDAAAEELNGGVLCTVLVQAFGRGHGAPISAPRSPGTGGALCGGHATFPRAWCRGMEGGEKSDRKTTVMIAWVLERKGDLLVWPGLWSEVVPGRGEFGGLFAPFSDGCRRRKRDRGSQ